MVEIEGPQEPRKSAGVDDQVERHREIMQNWIAAAIDGIREMHEDELARQQVTAIRAGIRADSHQAKSRVIHVPRHQKFQR